MATESRVIEITKLIVEVLRALAWPILFAAIVVAFHNPLRGVADGLAQKLSQANRVSIGSLSLEIEVKAKAIGDMEFARQIGNLSPEAVEALLLFPRNTNWTLLARADYKGKLLYGLPKNITTLRELEKKGFIEFKDLLEPFFAELNHLPKYKFDPCDDDDMEGADDFTWYSPPFSVDSAEDKRLSGQSYSQTEVGRLAVDAIVRAVAAQLAREPT